MRKEFTDELVTGPIRINSKLKEAPRAKVSIFTYDPKSHGAEDYWRLVKAVVADLIFGAGGRKRLDEDAPAGCIASIAGRVHHPSAIGRKDGAGECRRGRLHIADWRGPFLLE